MKWNRQGRMEEQPEKEISGYTTGNWRDTLQENGGIHYRKMERLNIEEKKQEKRKENEEGNRWRESIVVREK